MTDFSEAVAQAKAQGLKSVLARIRFATQAPKITRLEVRELGALDLTLVDLDLGANESITISHYTKAMTPEDHAKANELAEAVRSAIESLSDDGLCTACGEHTTPGASCCGSPVSFEGSLVTDESVHDRILSETAERLKTPEHVIRYVLANSLLEA